MDSSTPTTPISHQSKPHTIINTPSSIKKSPITMHSPDPIPLQDFFLLSPSPCRISRSRPRPLIVEESIDSVASLGSRRKGKSRGASGASPRNARRARRRSEKEEREPVHFEDAVGRVRKRRQGSKEKIAQKEERLALVASSLAPSSPSPETADDEVHTSVDGLWEVIFELVIWKNVAKSSLWFGFGTMFFMSSCFSKDVSFSMISAVSHLGLLILGLAFFYDSFPQRQQQKPKRANFKLTEEDILRFARLILPIANAALAKSQEVFSGEPLMTLKVAPVLFFTAKYGYLITPSRLFSSGFFLSFTLPKLYSCYCDSIRRKVKEMTSYLCEAWKSCPRKKFVAATTATMLWNVFSFKMRVFAALVLIAVLRYHHQQEIGGESAENESREGELQHAIMVAEKEL